MDTIDRPIVAWTLAAFLVTFVLTRVVTRLIRAGRGPFRDTTVGGVHIHHQVYGIFLLLGVGLLELAYRPASPWFEVLAVLFGVGAALTLDEFALWLRLDDVYWGPEGRRSVDAVLIASVIGALLLLGFSPFDDDAGDNRVIASVVLVVDMLFVLVAILKGRTLLGVVGVFVPVLALVAAVRLAHPRSPWARRRYRPGSARLARARRRFPEGRRNRWDPLVDLFAGRGPAPDPPSGPGAGPPGD
ncbi:hypothetical protein KDL28_15465 [Pseudonocardia sp. S2-4]|uniref:Integral membrane protein n=1 Tax=Pseudonocardia humida TaxID=2800819 RepID=A0ABT1A0P3_9PSEU|nr:hypothetical protein [Pseudonocardia humida]